MRATLIVIGLAVACGGGGPAPRPTAPTSASPTPASVCTPEEPKDCVVLGSQLEQGGKGITRDPARAAAYYRIACDAENAIACSILADLHVEGDGVARDEAERWRLLRRACDLGDCMTLALELLDADDVTMREEALRIFERICDDETSGEDERGTACHMRADRAPTRTDGAPWYEKACAHGHTTGCKSLAKIYFTDARPGMTPEAATRALETMCDRGFAPACDFVAQRHFEGKGAPASRTVADRWMQKGCDAGDEHLCEVLERRR